jgi:drug/metabolite transporter (DMT)-like permease
MSRFRIHGSVLAALCAAGLFGASTPFAKQLLSDQSPLLIAGLLYLGSGIGLTLVRFIRDRGWQSPHMAQGDWGWLVAAIAFGGAAGPALLMMGLQQTAAGTASLLLNLETVLTAVLAWIVFKENTDRRIVLGTRTVTYTMSIISMSMTKRGMAANRMLTRIGTRR